METLIVLLVWLIIIGVVFYLLVNYVLPAIPVDPPIKAAIVAVLALIVILMLLGGAVGWPHAPLLR